MEAQGKVEAAQLLLTWSFSLLQISHQPADNHEAQSLPGQNTYLGLQTCSKVLTGVDELGAASREASCPLLWFLLPVEEGSL